MPVKNATEFVVLAAFSDIQWAAGLFEGEGCVSGSRTKGHWYPRIQLAMTDLDTVERFRDVVGGGSITVRQPAQPNRKVQYCWCQSGWAFFDYFTDLFEHRLGERRRARIAEVRAIRDAS